jgi:uncharacterized protein (TIGR03437 family)
MNLGSGRELLLTFLALGPVLMAQAPRRPRGIYAVVRVEEYVNQQQQSNPSITQAQLDAFFNGYYQDLLNNPAISGITLQVGWKTLNPNPPTSSNPYFWNYVDDAFAQVAVWNSQNSTQAPKTIQFIVSPGFSSPAWMVAELSSCDGLFQTPVVTPPSTCGTATFLGYSEGNGTILPLPWNPIYKAAWQAFLTALAARYGSNPAFVSIDVGGPTAASTEMILPSDSSSNNPQTQFGTPISPNDMWSALLAFHYPGMAAYQKTDQAFIDEWDNAIDMFGQVFNGVTLTAPMTADGLPNFSQNFTIPNGYAAYCTMPTMHCAAATTVLSHFVEPTVGGANAKEAMTAGMEAARVGLDLSVPGTKLLTQSTAQGTSPSAQVLGGAQFDMPFSIDTLEEGCSVTFPPGPGDTPAGCTIPPTCNVDSCIPVVCIPQTCLAPGVTQASLATFGTYGKVPGKDLIPPEQALYNVLNQYFDGTAVASAFGGTTGTAPMNYMQIYSEDIQYATANVNTPAQVVEASGVVVSTTAQNLLSLASQKLLTIAEPPLLPAITSGGIVPGTVQPGEWISIYGTNLASETETWTGNFPTSLAGTSVTIDGKAAYLSFASYGQVNLQAPNDTATGSVSVVVTTATGTAKSTVTLASFSPQFFLLDGKHVAGIILRSNGSGSYGGGTYDIIGPTGTSLGYQTVAAKAGDSVALFGTGFGPTNPSVAPGQGFSGAAPTTNSVTLRINNASVTPTFAGLSGAGLDQINLTIPAGLGTGDVSLQSTVGGVQTPSGVVISLQ